MSDGNGSKFAPSEFLTALGAVTLNWAAVEAALDFTTAVMFHELRNDKMESEVPRSLEKKLKFIKQALQHEKLAKIEKPARAVISELLARKEDRHGLVHGAVLDADAESVTTLRVEYLAVRHKISSRRITIADVQNIEDRSHGLSQRATQLSIAVYNIARPADPIDYPLGDFSS
ncbi:hypothetical protein [Caulobacter henricii]|uniref:hypothetical protein n=1 Tax=Caulobacter henricii TaxID=69395 RepID=UPI00141255D1|nr:hypothetical protein [Caulobacter henricii]